MRSWYHNDQSDEIMAIFGSARMRNGFGRADNDSVNGNGKWHMNENGNHIIIAHANRTPLMHNDFSYNSHHNLTKWIHRQMFYRIVQSVLVWNEHEHVRVRALYTRRMFACNSLICFDIIFNFHAIFVLVLEKINCSFDLPDVLKAFRGNINWGNSAN